MNAALTWRAGAVLTAAGMSCGAFGSHGLRAINPPLPEKSIQNWHTASSYLIYNGIALLALSFHPRLIVGNGRFKLASTFIVSGASLFSGTIFGLTLSKDSGVRKILGPLTPLGGLFMIGGYILLI